MFVLKKDKKLLELKDSLFIYSLSLLYVQVMHLFTKGSYFTWIQIVFPFGLVLFPVLYCLRYECALTKVFGLKKPRVRQILYGLCLIVGIFLLMQIVAQWVKPFLPDYYFASLSLNSALKTRPVLMSFLSIVLLPAIFEELLFRGFIQTGLAQGMSFRCTVLFSACLFAALHLDPYRFIFIFVPGLALSWAMLKTQSIFVPITMHFIHNLIPYCFIVLPINLKITNKSGFRYKDSMLMLISLFLLFIGIWGLSHCSKNLKTEPEYPC